MKSRLPKGYGGGAPSNMNEMLKQAQKMQELMAKKQEELAERIFEASSGGGAVSVKATGDRVLTEVTIKPEVVDPDDVEILSDLIMAAVNQALRTAEEETNREMDAITGGASLPGI